MATGNSLDCLVQHLRRRCGDGPADGDLLAQFATQRDEAAFAELVHRHGGLVFGVARRHLPDRHAAEDVVQTTFAALARSASRLGRPPSLVNWLYTVALRQARRARLRFARGKSLLDRLPPLANPLDPLAEVSGRELVTIIDDELERLPAVYRLPLLLCALEGLSREEAARRLGWPIGSVKGRLERGREILRTRLAKRGLTVPVVLVGGLLVTPNEALPAGLIATVTRTAMNLPTTAMPLKMVAATGILLLALGVGTGVALSPGGPPQPKADSPAAAEIAEPQPRIGADELPLPPEALARFGSSRMRSTHAVNRLAVSPDGKTLVSSSGDVRMWDAATGNLIRRFAIRPEQLGGLLGFAPDGHDLLCVTTTSFDRSILRLDPSTRHPRWMVDTKDATNTHVPYVCLSPDARRIAFAAGDDTLKILDVESGQELKTVSHAKGRPRGLAFSPDDRTLAVTDQSDSIMLYDTATGAVASELHFPKDAQFYSVAFSPDSRTLAAVSATRSVARVLHFWDLTTGKYRGTLEGPDEGRATGFRFSPDGKSLVAYHHWSESTLWDTDGRSPIRKFPGVYSATSAAFSPNGKTLYTGTQHGTILAWDVATGRLLPISANPGAAVTGISFSHDGRKLIGTAERVITWDTNSGKELERGPLVDADFGITVPSPDGRTVACTKDGIIRLFDAVSGKEIRRFEGESGDHRPEVLVWTPDSRRILAANKQKQIVVRDATTGKVIEKMAGHSSWVTQLAMSPDGRRLASTATGELRIVDDSIRVWDLNGFKELQRFTSPGWQPGPAAFAPDAKTLAAGGAVRDGTDVTGEVHLWDIDSGRRLRSFTTPGGIVNSVAFSPNGRMVAIGDSKGRLFLVETATGQLRHQFHGEAGEVDHLAFTPDGNTLASASSDAPIFFWDIYARAASHAPPTAEQLNRLWADLAAEHAEITFRAARCIINAPNGAAFICERLKPTPPADADKVKTWIAQLDSSKYAERQSAAKELAAVYDCASDQIRTAFAESKSAEVRRALRLLLDRLDTPPPETLRSLRAVEILEQIGTPAARDHLKALAGGAPGATLTRAAQEALKRLSK